MNLDRQTPVFLTTWLPRVLFQPQEEKQKPKNPNIQTERVTCPRLLSQWAAGLELLLLELSNCSPQPTWLPLPWLTCALARRGAPPLLGQGCGYGLRCCPAPGALAPSEPASWVGAGQPAWCTPPFPSCVWSPLAGLSPGSLSYLVEVRVPGDLRH